MPHTVSFFRINRLFVTGVFLAVLCSSCGEEYPDPMFTSSVIQGRINPGYMSEGPLEDFTITALGPYGELSTLTDSNGRFEFNGLGNGTYSLEIAREGYGTKYEYGIQLFGFDTAWVWVDAVHLLATGTMPELLSVETSKTSFSWLLDNSIAITTNRKSGEVQARAFLAEYDDVSYKNYQWTSDARSLHRGGFDNLMFLVETVPFESGKKIYLILYICNEYDRGYLNSYTGQWTFSTLEPEKRSKVMDFIMP